LLFETIVIYLYYTVSYFQNTMNFEQFFTTLWFTKKESDIFLTLYKLWNQPASTIAKYLNTERTWVYKTLIAFSQQWLVSTTIVKWVKHFFIASPSILLSHIEKKKQTLESLEAAYENVSQELVQYESQRYPHLPKISLFDWIDWTKALYNDIYDTVINNKYLVIKFFASNTFESQTNVHSTLKDFSHNVFEKLQKKRITIETYLWNGILIMEQISKTTTIDNLADLPAWNSAINIFVVGKVIYMIIFKDIPFGIKIDSEDVANTMHFLFERLETS